MPLRTVAYGITAPISEAVIVRFGLRQVYLSGAESPTPRRVSAR